MPVATKTRPINLRFKPSTPTSVLKEIQNRYNRFMVEKEKLEDYFQTDLHRQTSASMAPGDWLRTLRDAHGWTQAYLGVEIGGISAKRISDWESGRRAISKDVIKKLSGIFQVPAEKFI